MSRLRFAGIGIGFLMLGLMPSLAAAQSTIAGVVKDSSGAVLPGVTVEASSPVLIEKSRSVVSDGEGRYAIVDIRPGTYGITFTLAGFMTFKRDDVIVPANTAVPINAELHVGSLEETVTVSGQSPVVDVQSTARTQVLTREMIDAIPNARNMQALGALMSGIRITIPEVGGNQQTEQPFLIAHGNNQIHNTVLVDGLVINTALADGSYQQYVDNALVQETAFQTSGISAESSAGGVRVNMVTKDGGNTVHGAGFFGGSSGQWQGTNLTPDLTVRGLKSGASIQHIEDFNGSTGGPVVRDRLWYFGSARYQGTNNVVPNSFYPDGSPGVDDVTVKSLSARLTWQIGPKNKLALLYDRPFKTKYHSLTTSVTGTPLNPATDSDRRPPILYYLGTAKWTATLTNKLLLETGYSSSVLHYRDDYQPGIGQVRGTPAWYAMASHLDTGTNTRTVAGQPLSLAYPNRFTFSETVSYVTGSHAFKTGMQYGFGENGSGTVLNADLVQNYQSGRPVNVTVYNTPVNTYPEVNADVGIFAQDQWSIKRATISAGLRYDYLKESVGAQTRPAGRFAPALSYPAVNCEVMSGLTCWHSLSPRLGLAYDVFGNGKTAAHASFGRYETPNTGSFINLFNPVATATETRTWTDTDRSGLNLPTNGDGIAEDNEIGPSPNPSFGKITSRTLDPNFKREYNLQYNIGVQQELRTGMAVSLNWYRRSLYNTQFSDNYAVNAIYSGANANWSPFTVVNPLTGEVMTAFNLNKDHFGLTPDTHLSTLTGTSLRRNIYTGFELGLSARLRRRTNVFAGWTFDRQTDVNCASTDDPNTFRFCDQSGNSMLGEPAVTLPFRHDFKFAGNLPLWYGFEMSAALQSYAGAAKAVTWSITPGTRYPADCSVPGCTPGVPVFSTLTNASLSIPLTAPGSRFEPRWNQLDLGVKRTFKVGGGRQVQAQIDVFNALNGHAVLTEITALTTSAVPFLSSDPNAGGTPITVLQPRILRLGMQLRF